MSQIHVNHPSSVKINSSEIERKHQSDILLSRRNSAVTVLPNHSVQWWLAYFRFGYYMGYMPCLFNVRQSGTFRGAPHFEVQLHKTQLHEVIYTLLMLVTTSNEFVCFWNFDGRPHSDQPTSDIKYIFQELAEFGFLLNQVVGNYIVFRSQERARQIISLILEAYPVSSKSMSKFSTAKLMTNLICFIWLSFFINGLIGSVAFMMSPNSSVGDTNLLTKLANFFLTSKAKNNSDVVSTKLQQYFSDAAFSPNITGASVSDTIILSASMVLRTISWWLGYMSTLIVAFQVLLYSHIMDDFAAEVPQLSVNQVQTRYMQVCKIVSSLNEMLGFLFFTTIFGGAPYYIGKIRRIFHDGFTFKLVRRFCLFSMFMFQLYYPAAKYQKAAEAMKSWICNPKNAGLLDSTELHALMFQLSQQDGLALSVFGVFQINYNFSTSVTSGLLAYAIIEFQLA